MVTTKKLDSLDIEKRIEKLWKTPECPFSGHNERTIVDQFVEVKPFSETPAMVIGGGVYPAVMFVCRGCGYMALFSAMVLGLLDREEITSG